MPLLRGIREPPLQEMRIFNSPPCSLPPAPLPLLMGVGFFGYSLGGITVFAVGVSVIMAGLDYSVTAVVTFVNHIDFASFSIVEHIKVVSH